MRRPLLALVLVLTALAPAARAADDPSPPREIAGPVEARVVRVRDGDTVEVEAFVWPMQSVSVAVRLRNVDAPELRAKCDSERRSAEAARERFRQLVGQGPVFLSQVSGDKYFGRVLARLGTRDTPDIGAVLLREGLVDAYDGGRRRDWCNAVGAALPERPKTPERPAATTQPGLFWRG
ncbi:thermonuclease family protein [Aureimonas jatrophae]|jgi:micrococcal nuclease|uniref:Endonuclease YncB, thermonuclease family n=1 Tax=Aureimonas jatrophae TaxID=1166073 RepID=A0A1H0K8P8_9HYPH|nr:thermonuclease family protein [Aureimonas jatrophae]MBB3951003.1 endonuclease YncB(thermonuclease family) [Aureimonas jatrophae]SDO52335.1 Endonuclease YncB, thermonuclease family [Aureimonas jatrophae]